MSVGGKLSVGVGGWQMRRAKGDRPTNNVCVGIKRKRVSVLE